MPHQCVRCNKIYENASKEILKGCSCGAKMFFFIKKAKQTEDQEIKLSKKEKNRIETDIREIVGETDVETPIILDFESIRVVKTGKYELDLVSLFKKNPLIYKMGDGKYMIDLAKSMENSKTKN